MRREMHKGKKYDQIVRLFINQKILSFLFIDPFLRGVFSRLSNFLKGYFLNDGLLWNTKEGIV